MKLEIVMQDGMEQDIFKARQICHPNRSRVIKYIKRKYNKRVRRNIKMLLNNGELGN